MKKNLISKLSTLTLAIVMLASCSEKAGEYTNAIPADASIVIELHVQSLLDKRGADNDDKQQFINAIKGTLSATSLEHIEKIIRNGSESGISIEDPIYFFANEAFNTPIVVAKVSNIDKLNKTLEVLIAEELISPVEKNNGFYSTNVGNNEFIAFNNTTLLVTEGARKQDTGKVTELLKLSKDKSMASNPDFQTMVKNKGDISCYFTMDALTHTEVPVHAMNGIADLKEMGSIVNLYFEKGKISMQAELVTQNEKIKELFKKQDKAFGKLDETFVNKYPVSTLIFAAFNFDGEKVFDLLKENEEFGQHLAGEDGEKVKEILSSIKGDFSFGLTDVSMSEAPSFIAYAEAKSGVALDALYEFKNMMGLSRSEDIVKVGDNEYVLKSREMNIYFGYKDKFIYATNSQSAYKTIGQKEDKSLKEAVYASNMKGKKLYMVVDINSILNLPAVKMLSALGGRQVANNIAIAKNFSYIECLSESNSKCTVNVWLSNKNENGLKVIVDLAKSYAGL